MRQYRKQAVYSGDGCVLINIAVTGKKITFCFFRKFYFIAMVQNLVKISTKLSMVRT